VDPECAELGWWNRTVGGVEEGPRKARLVPWGERDSFDLFPLNAHEKNDVP